MQHFPFIFRGFKHSSGSVAAKLLLVATGMPGADVSAVKDCAIQTVIYIASNMELRMYQLSLKLNFEHFSYY